MSNNNILLSQEQNLNQNSQQINQVYDNNALEQENKQKFLNDFNNQNNLINVNQASENYDFQSYSFYDQSIYGIDNFTITNNQFDYLNAGFNTPSINCFGSNFITQEWDDELFQNSGNLF
uniref:Uncharacterized protein n=1 Tax=Meloidogyne enterolobii TaxID=390850 RepID=A0A6V7TJF7_MELEN|nr:unnamed protein product [Meloidogyne enterolobii]